VGGKRGRNVNYFANLGAECHFAHNRFSESSFPKKKKGVSVIYLNYGHEPTELYTLKCHMVQRCTFISLK
jgi:hypothetical protein